MTVTTAATCRWATQTLFLNNGVWLDAWEYPWTCVREGVPRLLRALDECAACAHWECRSETRPVGASNRPAPASEGRV